MYTIEKETVEYEGLTAEVKICHDGDMGAPWIEDDCHGVIRELGRYENKKPSEYILRTNGRSRYAYDIQATKKQAMQEGWGCSDSEGLTRKQIIAKAIQSDIEYCEGWLLDYWQWCGFVVEIDGEHVDSCWGFDDESYCMEEGKAQAMHELKNRHEKAKKENAEREYWASRDIETV